MEARSFNPAVNPVQILCYTGFGSFIFGTCTLYWFMDRPVIGKSEDTLAFWRIVNLRGFLVSQGVRGKLLTKEMTRFSLKNGHVWFSVFLRHPGDYMTSVKRWTVLITFLFISLTISSIVIGWRKGYYFSSLFWFPVSIVVTLLGLPVPGLLMLFFRRQMPQYSKIENNYGATLSAFLSFSWIRHLIMGPDKKAKKGAREIDLNAMSSGNIAVKINSGLPELPTFDEDAIKFLVMDHPSVDERMRAQARAFGEHYSPQKRDSRPDQSVSADFMKKNIRPKLTSKIQLLKQTRNPSGALAGVARTGAASGNINNGGPTPTVSESEDDKFYKRKTNANYASTPVPLNESLRGQIDIDASGSIKNAEPKHKSRLLSSLSTLIRMPIEEEIIKRSGLKEGQHSDWRLTTLKLKSSSITDGLQSDATTTKGNKAREFITLPPESWEYSRQDIVAVSGCFVVMFGCWLAITAIDSNNDHNRQDRVLWLTFVVFLEDILLRALFLHLRESWLFFPFEESNSAWKHCCCCLPGPLNISGGDEENEGKLQEGGIYVTFKANKIGFRFLNRRVCKVEPGSQAEEKGVRVGWKIESVMDRPIKNDEEAFEQIQRAHRLHDEFEIQFAPRMHLDMSTLKQENEVEVLNVVVDVFKDPYWNGGRTAKKKMKQPLRTDMDRFNFANDLEFHIPNDDARETGASRRLQQQQQQQQHLRQKAGYQLNETAGLGGRPRQNETEAPRRNSASTVITTVGSGRNNSNAISTISSIKQIKEEGSRTSILPVIDKGGQRHSSSLSSESWKQLRAERGPSTSSLFPDERKDAKVCRTENDLMNFKYLAAPAYRLQRQREQEAFISALKGNNMVLTPQPRSGAMSRARHTLPPTIRSMMLVDLSPKPKKLKKRRRRTAPPKTLSKAFRDFHRLILFARKEAIQVGQFSPRPSSKKSSYLEDQHMHQITTNPFPQRGSFKDVPQSRTCNSKAKGRKRGGVQIAAAVIAENRNRLDDGIHDIALLNDDNDKKKTRILNSGGMDTKHMQNMQRKQYDDRLHVGYNSTEAFETTTKKCEEIKDGKKLRVVMNEEAPCKSKMSHHQDLKLIKPGHTTIPIIAKSAGLLLKEKRFHEDDANNATPAVRKTSTAIMISLPAGQILRSLGSIGSGIAVGNPENNPTNQQKPQKKINLKANHETKRKKNKWYRVQKSKYQRRGPGGRLKPLKPVNLSDSYSDDNDDVQEH